MIVTASEAHNWDKHDTIFLDGGTVEVADTPRCLEDALDRPDEKLGVRDGLLLREMFATEFALRTRFRLPAARCMLMDNGSTNIVHSVFEWFAAIEKSIVVFTPSWFGFHTLAEDCGAQIINLPLDADFQPSPERLKDALADRRLNVGGVLINNYGTPTGVRIHPERLKAIAEVVLRSSNDAVLIEDCLFWNVLFQRDDIFGYAGTLVPELWQENRLIGFASLSKCFATYYSMGFVWAGGVIQRFIQRSIADNNSGPSVGRAAAFCSAFSAEGARTADRVATSCRDNLKSLKLLRGFSPFKLAVEPNGGTNALLDLSLFNGLMHRGRMITDELQLIDSLEQRAGVVIKPGHSFKSRPFAARVNLAGAPPEMFRAAMVRMRNFAQSCY